MTLLKKHTAFLALLLATAGLIAFAPQANDNIIAYTTDPAKEKIQFFWKDDKGAIFRNIGNLKPWLDARKTNLVFAMNGGMYMENNAPLGLYIENGKKLTRINRDSGYGNFYLKPNGIFYITKANKAVVCRTEDYKGDNNVKFATQSGPMLVINGSIHPAFKKGSKNIHIRNGVGILPGGRVLFAISKREINLYDIASYFKDAGCKNALFLDGFVSRAYHPGKNWIQTDGNFGVIIAVTQ
jgi:uncharacterized protein YigE (DUF2233 family)